jgi:hypothetical protein
MAARVGGDRLRDPVGEPKAERNAQQPAQKIRLRYDPRRSMPIAS